MTKPNNLSRRSVLAMGGVGALALASRRAWAESAPLKIGIVTELTGIASAYGNSQVNGIQLAIDEINAAGGLLGRPITLIVRDSQSKPDLGVSNARALITSEQDELLIGPVSSGVALGISNLAKQNKVPVIMAGPNTPRLSMELFHPYFFTMVPSGLMESRAMVKAIGTKFRTFGFIGADYEAPRQGLATFKAALKAVNPEAEVIVEAFPKLGEPDHTNYITRLLSARPEAIYSYLWGADLVGFVKQAKSYGLFDRTTFASMFFFDDLRPLGEEMPDGIIGQMRAPFFALEGDKVGEFVKNYRAKYNEYPADWAIMAYEAIQVYNQAATSAGKLDSDSIVAALEAVHYDGLRGPISFRKEDHQATVPCFVGTSMADSAYPFKIFGSMNRIAAEEVWPSLDEVAASRHG
jgi:branched-chain amino acid transport system substrate-binding protein